MSDGSTNVVTERRVGELIDARYQGLEKSVSELAQDLRNQTTTLTEYVTVTRRHVRSQESMNAYLQRLVEDHGRRIGTLEVRQALVEERVPGKLIDAETIEQQREKDAQRVQQLSDQVDGLSATIARYAGIAVGVVVVAQIITPPLIKVLFG